MAVATMTVDVLHIDEVKAALARLARAEALLTQLAGDAEAGLAYYDDRCHYCKMFVTSGNNDYPHAASCPILLARQFLDET